MFTFTKHCRLKFEDWQQVKKSTPKFINIKND